MLNDKELYYYKALELISNGKFTEAFQYLYQCDPFKEPINPKTMSYYGYCLARAYRRSNVGAKICREALLLNPRDPDLYCNLARVYLNKNDKQLAIRTLYNGLKYTRGNKVAESQILNLIKTIVKRRPPFIKSLPRQNPINKIVGRITYARWNRINAAKRSCTHRHARFSDYLFLPVQHYFGQMKTLLS